jgi:hypothetical protein
VTDVEGTKKGTRAKPRVLRVTAAIATAAGVLLISVGFVGGWAANDRIQAARSEPGPSVIEIPARADLDGIMPDIRGLNVADARQVIVDVGFDPNTIEVSGVPWAGDPDLVISQDPVVGEHVTGTISLKISEAARVPDVIGQNHRDAIDVIRALGAEPEVVEAFDLQAPTGSVLSIEPAVGELLPRTVRVTVAQPGSALYLNKLRAVSGSCSSTEAQINAQAYKQSLRCGTGTTKSPRTTVWLLNRKVQVISGVIGINDKDDPGLVVDVTVIGDGQVLGTYTTSYAHPAEVNLAVPGVLRLEVQATSGKSANVVLGDWILKGTTEDIDALESGS